VRCESLRLEGDSLSSDCSETVTKGEPSDSFAAHSEWLPFAESA